MKKRNSLLKKGLVLLLAVTMVAALAGCTKKNNQKTDNAEAKNYVYSYTDLPIDINDENIMSYIYGEDYFYACLSEWDNDTGISSYSIAKIGYDGTVQSTTPLFSNEDSSESQGSFSRGVVGSDGKLYGIKYSYSSSGDGEDYTWKESNSLVQLGEDGNAVWSVELGDWSKEDYYYVTQVFTDTEGKLWVADATQFTQFSDTGEIVKEVKNPVENSSGDFFKCKDGTLMIGVWDETTGNVKFTRFNLATGELTPDIVIPDTYSYCSNYVGTGSDYDMLATDTNCLYGYNWGDTTMTKLMDFIGSDFEGTGLYDVHPTSATEFVARYSDLDYNYRTAKFTKVPADQIKDKNIITLGCYYMDNAIRKQVLAFNRSHEEVRISITDYSTMNKNDDYSYGLNQLNSDIISGNVPDIFVANNQIDMDSYIAKGLFTDLYPYMEADANINKEDFLPNILALGEYDGKLVQIIPKFGLISMAVNSDYINGATSWTLEDAKKAVNNMPEGATLFAPDARRADILSYCMTMAFDQFYNVKTGECHFDSPEFIALLELMKEYPEEVSDDIYNDQEFWNNYEVMYRNGSVLAGQQWLSDFSTYASITQGTFGGKVSLIGFPTATGTGSAANVDLTFAVSENSSYKQECWDFVSYFLSDDYQNNFGDYYFATKRSALEAQADRAMNPVVETYTNEEGDVVPYQNTWYIGGEEIVINPITQDEVDYVMSVLEGIDHKTFSSEDINNIINEEAAAYFSGQKTAEAVAAVIQSRVKIFVNEKR